LIRTLFDLFNNDIHSLAQLLSLSLNGICRLTPFLLRHVPLLFYGLAQFFLQVADLGLLVVCLFDGLEFVP
jgi:hypothetical protein